MIEQHLRGTNEATDAVGISGELSHIGSQIIARPGRDRHRDRARIFHHHAGAREELNGESRGIAFHERTTPQVRREVDMQLRGEKRMSAMGDDPNSPLLAGEIGKLPYR